MRCPDWTHKIAICVVSVKQFDSSVKHPGWRKAKRGTVVRVLIATSPVLALTRGAVDLSSSGTRKQSDNRKTSLDACNVLGRLILGRSLLQSFKFMVTAITRQFVPVQHDIIHVCLPEAKICQLLAPCFSCQLSLLII